MRRVAGCGGEFAPAAGKIMTGTVMPRGLVVLRSYFTIRSSPFTILHPPEADALLRSKGHFVPSPSRSTRLSGCLRQRQKTEPK